MGVAAALSAALLVLVLMTKRMSEGTMINAAGVIVGQQNGVCAQVPNFRSFDDLFLAYGEQYKVNPVLLKAIALRESTLNPQAKNEEDPRDPSYGLMQISCMPDGQGGCKAREFRIDGWPPPNGKADLYEPAVSIRYAAEIMAANLAETRGNIWEAVAMYNSGTRVDPVYVAAVKKWYYLMGGVG